MSLPRILLVLMLLVTGCGEQQPIPASDLLLRVTVGAGQIAPGQAFPLTVHRVWEKSCRPEEWRIKKLAPLEVRLVETTRREDEKRIEEIRHYRAFAFSLKEIKLGEITFKVFPKDGGPARQTKTGELTIPVVPALDPTNPGGMEMPGPPLDRPTAPLTWVAGGALVIFFGLLLWYLARRKPTPRAPAPTPVNPASKIQDRLTALRALAIPDEAASQVFHVEAAAALRDYLEERFALCRPEMTTDEFMAAPRTMTILLPPQRELLSRSMAHCDLVKFSRQPTTPDQREELLTGMDNFVRETGNDSPATPTAEVAHE